MLSYCLKCKKENRLSKPCVTKTIKEEPMLLSNCTVCGSTKLKYTIKQEN